MQRCRTRVTPALLGLVSLAAAVGTGGCQTMPDASRPRNPLPRYAGHEAQLFDDAVEPAAVGLDYQKDYLPRADMQLRERAQRADGVLRVRVSTFTSKNDGPGAVYQMNLHPVEKLTGSAAPTGDIPIAIDKSSESFGIMKSFESRMVGQSFIAFVRTYVRADGESVTHFHLAPDTKEVKLAISDALLLGSVDDSAKK